MTESHRVKCSALEFLDCLYFPRFETQDYETRMHHRPEVTDAEFHLLMDPAKVGDAIKSNPKPNDLKVNFKAYYYILCKTICPLVGPHSQGNINGVLRNTLYALSYGFVFDVEDLFIRLLVDAANEHLPPKCYAPSIQKLINIARQTKYLAKVVSMKFIPPMRDTLQVVEDNTKGKKSSPTTIPCIFSCMVHILNVFRRFLFSNLPLFRI